MGRLSQRFRSAACTPAFFATLYLTAIPAFALVYAFMWRELQQSMPANDAGEALLNVSAWEHLAAERIGWLPTIPAPPKTVVQIIPGRPAVIQEIGGFESRIGDFAITMNPTVSSDFYMEGGVLNFRQEMLFRPSTAERSQASRYWIKWRVYPASGERAFREAMESMNAEQQRLGTKRFKIRFPSEPLPGELVSVELTGIPNAITLALPMNERGERVVSTERVIGRIWTGGEGPALRSGAEPPVDPKGADSILKGYWKVSAETQAILNEYRQVQQGRPVPARFGFGRYLYLSVVTITTLGFGDIIPTTDRARLVVSLEAISGIVIAGLFLNALAMRIASHAADRATSRQQSRSKNRKNSTDAA